MNEQMIYIGMTIIAVACLFLIYQNYQMRMAHALDISRINKTIKDMGNSMDNNKLIANPNTENPGNIEEFNNQAPEQLSNEDSTYNKLKNEYDNYVNTDMEQIESHSEANDDYELDEALKQKIESLSAFEDKQEANHNISNDTSNLMNSNINEYTENTETSNIDENHETTDSPLDNQNNQEELQEVIDNRESDNQELNNEETIESDEINIQPSSDIELQQLDDDLNINSGDIDFNDNLPEDRNSITNLNVDELNSDLNLEDIESLEIDDNLDDNLEDINTELNDDNLESLNVDTIPLSNQLNSSKEYLENLTLKELQTLARDKNVKVKGRKSELIERLIPKI